MPSDDGDQNVRGDDESDDERGTVEVEVVIDGLQHYVQMLALPGRWLRSRLEDHGDDLPPGDPGLLLDLLRGCVQATLVGAADTTESGVELTVLDVVLDLHRLEPRDPAGDVSLHLSDHGEPAEISIPDDAAVIDPADLEQLFPELVDLSETALPPEGGVWTTPGRGVR